MLQPPPTFNLVEDTDDNFEKAVEVTIIETTYTKGHTVFC